MSVRFGSRFEYNLKKLNKIASGGAVYQIVSSNRSVNSLWVETAIDAWDTWLNWCIKNYNSIILDENLNKLWPRRLEKCFYVEKMDHYYCSDGSERIFFDYLENALSFTSDTSDKTGEYGIFLTRGNNVLKLVTVFNGENLSLFQKICDNCAGLGIDYEYVENEDKNDHDTMTFTCHGCNGRGIITLDEYSYSEIDVELINEIINNFVD